MIDWRATDEQLANRGVLAPFAIVTDDDGDRRQLMVVDDVPTRAPSRRR